MITKIMTTTDKFTAKRVVESQLSEKSYFLFLYASLPPAEKTLANDRFRIFHGEMLPAGKINYWLVIGSDKNNTKLLLENTFIN